MKEHLWVHEWCSLRGDRALCGKQSYLWSSCGDSEVPMQPVQSQVSLAVFVQLESPSLSCPWVCSLGVCSRLNQFGFRSSLGQCRHVCGWFMGSCPQKSGGPGPKDGSYSQLKGCSWSCVPRGVWQQCYLEGCPVPLPATCVLCP